MPNIKISFQIPVSRNTVRGGLHSVKHLGDITVSAEGNTSDIDDIEITEVDFSCTVLEFLEHFEQYGRTPMEVLYESATNHMEYRRYSSQSL